jgi:hypothetical protein
MLLESITPQKIRPKFYPKKESIEIKFRIPLLNK